MAQPVQRAQRDALEILRFSSRQQLGESAGETAAEWLRERLANQARVRMIFAAAPSQNEFLATLAAARGIDWQRVTVFHMDEYIGLSADAPQRFSHFLRQHLFDKVQPGEVHLIPSQGDPQALCHEYAALISAAPVDAVCLGIGENGHLAFNDPPVADFNDPAVIKAVTLDAECRQQQVNDGCFASLDEVPGQALTLTIPTLMQADRLFCMVPGQTKRQAVTRTLYDAITTACPATILRRHPACTLFTDTDACPQEVRIG